MIPLGLKLPIRSGNQGYFDQSFDTLTQLKSNMINFFLTVKGERPMLYEFGSDLYSYVFENMEENEVGDVAENIIRDECKIWFPMIEVKGIKLTRSLRETTIYSVNITLSFSVVGVLAPPTELEFTLKNDRN